MRIWIATVLLAFSSAVSAAGGAGIHMDEWPAARARNLASLQNGARLFANYCLNCHSASYMRWNRLNEIGLDDKQIRDFLIFGEQKVGEQMRVAMRPADAKSWFGKVPPDLSVIARARTSFEYKGTDYLYTLLRGYYRDAGSATGWNNVVYPNIAMPHILWQRQGPREVTISRVAHEVVDKGGSKASQYFREVTTYAPSGEATVTKTELPGHPAEAVEVTYKPVDPAQARQFDSDVADLVAYLAYMTDPTASSRVRIGVWVLLFLTLFTGIAWWLNRVYWKDIK